MADKANNGPEELMQAYNKAVASGFEVVNAGMAQSSSTLKSFTDAVETERDEYGKVVEQAASLARTRGESMISLMQNMSTVPGPGIPGFSEEARKSVSELIQGEITFSQNLAKTWMEYLTGVETRRNAAAREMLERNAKMMESGQEAVKSAAKYGEAVLDWTVENANGMKS